MNLNVFNNQDNSGKMVRESFLMTNYKEEHQYIVEFCERNNLLDIPFKEKVYLAIKGIKEYPKCKNTKCNNKVTFINTSVGYRKYCSNKCVGSDIDIINKKAKKSIEKWGTKTPAESSIIKDKIIETNIIKYGGKSPMSSDVTRKKSKDTLIKNWGIDNPSKSKEILAKRIESFKLSDYKENYKKTSLERYGVDHPWMNKDIHEKTVEFFYSDYKKRIEDKISGSEFKFKGIKKDMTTYLSFNCKNCKSDFDILPYQFYYRNNSGLSICTNCFPISENASISQKELYEFIKSNYDDEIITDCKNIISPYEIDIYLPKLKIGFEFNGVYWHSNKYKEKNYHLNKVEISRKEKVKLYTIWEDDWSVKREICHSFILNKIGKSNKIMARKCRIGEVSYKISKKFLDENHFQGDCKSSVRIGLFNNNELVSLMTFSKLRLPIQRSKANRPDGCYELTRFCNRGDTVVIGGASKIINHFITNYTPIRIETYSDNLISNGDLYEKLGFTYVHTSNPGYWYLINGIREHRFNWRKQRLIKLGYDSKKTEEEIMNEMGHYKIYNAGNKKWIREL